MTKIGKPKGFDDSGPITAANYAERAMAFVRAKGLPPNDDGSRTGGYVVRAGSAQWTAWMDYLASKGVLTAFAEQHGLTTVPAEWPHQFEPGWVISTPPRPAPPAARRPWNREKEPWLANARWELGSNGTMFVPSHEVDRCYREWLGAPAKREPFEWLANLPGATERERVLAGLGLLKGEVAKAAVHMDMDRALDERRAPSWRDMTPSQAQDRLAKVTADYADKAPVANTPAMAAYLQRMRVVDPIEEVEF